MEVFIATVHIVVALFMILVVLIQGGHQGGVGAAFGGGNSQGVFGASGATSFLGKLTYGAAFLFMITSIGLVILQGGGQKTGMSDRAVERSKDKASQVAPVEDKGQAGSPSDEEQQSSPDNDLKQ